MNGKANSTTELRRRINGSVLDALESLLVPARLGLSCIKRFGFIFGRPQLDICCLELNFMPVLVPDSCHLSGQFLYRSLLSGVIKGMTVLVG